MVIIIQLVFARKMTVKRVAIVGAGASGLPSIKACKEVGLEPVCFEAAEDLGGLWRFKEDIEDGMASAMKCTIINSSKVGHQL